LLRGALVRKKFLRRYLRARRAAAAWRVFFGIPGISHAVAIFFVGKTVGKSWNIWANLWENLGNLDIKIGGKSMGI
jgi:hypothetical protein